MAGLKQDVRLVKHEQCQHAVKGEALPQFAEGQPSKPRRMADEGGIAASHGRRHAVVHRALPTKSAMTAGRSGIRMRAWWIRSGFLAIRADEGVRLTRFAAPPSRRRQST